MERGEKDKNGNGKEIMKDNETKDDRSAKGYMEGNEFRKKVTERQRVQ